MSETTGARANGKRAMLSIGIVVVATFLVYLPVRSADFINWDDLEQFAHNPDFNPPRLDRMIGYVRGPYLGSLYPVAYWYAGAVSAIARTDAPDARGVQLNPRIFHLGNVLLHALAAVGVLLLLRELHFELLPATIGALIFALHPVHVDAVAWVAGMNTPLSGMLAIVALAFYVRFARARMVNEKIAWTWYALASVAYVLALLSKPSAVVVPVLAAIIDFGLVRKNWRTMLAPVGAWLAAAVPFMIITRSLQAAAGVMETPFWLRPFVAADAIGFYATHVLAPVTLLVDYGRSPSMLLSSGAWKYSWVIAAALVACAFAWRRTAGSVTVAILLFIAGVLPVLGLTPFNGQTISTVSDRFLYLSMLGVALLAAHLVMAMRRDVVLPIAVVTLMLLGARTFARCTDWKDEQTLFTRELRNNPASIAAHEVLGAAASAANDQASAIQHYAAAMRVNSRDKRIPFNLANALLRSGRPAEAIPFYERAIKQQDAAGETTARDPRIPYNLGIAYVQTGNIEHAKTAFDVALKIRGDFELARLALAKLNATQPTTAP